MSDLNVNLAVQLQKESGWIDLDKGVFLCVLKGFIHDLVIRVRKQGSVCGNQQIMLGKRALNPQQSLKGASNSDQRQSSVWDIFYIC